MYQWSKAMFDLFDVKEKEQLQSCPFCSLVSHLNSGNHTSSQEEIIAINNYFFAKLDLYPVCKGHSLIIPKRHVTSLFNLKLAEFTDLFALMLKVRDYLINFQNCNPDGFTIGINNGAAAGQTISHLHIHLIPRSTQELENPKGGIRKLLASSDINHEFYKDLDETLNGHHTSLRLNKNFVLENHTFILKPAPDQISKLHMVLSAKRDVESVFKLSFQQISDLYDILPQARNYIEELSSKPVNGFNLGVNEGKASGKLSTEFHFHIIPRFSGDVKKPKGGVRKVISNPLVNYPV